MALRKVVLESHGFVNSQVFHQRVGWRQSALVLDWNDLQRLRNEEEGKNTQQ